MAKSKEKAFEEAVEKAASKFEAGLIRWIRNDRFFDGFRNTYARILITALTWLTLYGLGAYAFITPGAVNWYCAALLLLALMNQLSVRYAFNVDHEKHLTDEYQAKRRDASYRRAYRRVSSQLLSGLVVFFAVRYFWGDAAGSSAQFPEAGQVQFFVQLNVEEIIVLGAYYIGVFGLQKYMSWGFKGEPWLSKDEQP